MPTDARTRNRKLFSEALPSDGLKIQVGARGAKNGANWTAIDLFDTSPIIDHNWDLQNLPIANETVDCFVCNAVLEHVTRPDLAVYEMWRTLRSGGNIWIEVPFLQFYHAHPYDFYRWTVAGLDVLMEDFEKVASGIAEGAAYEAQKFIRYMNTDARRAVSEDLVESAAAFIREREAEWKQPRFYSSVYFWGKKRSNSIAPEKEAYMEMLKRTL